MPVSVFILAVSLFGLAMCDEAAMPSGFDYAAGVATMSDRDSRGPTAVSPEPRRLKASGNDRVASAISDALQQASAAFTGGDWGQAEQLCGIVLTAQPDCCDALNLLGIIKAQTRRSEEAAELLARVSVARPDDAVAQNNYGNVLKDLRRYDAALDCYARAVTLKPDYSEAYNNRGTALKELGRFDDALDSYGRALAANGNNAEAYYNRAVTLHDLKQVHEALADYQCALRVKPDYAEAHYNRGNALGSLRRLDEALHSYDRALLFKPDFAEACNNRGNVLQDLKLHEEALRSYDRALVINPALAQAHLNRGITLKDLRRLAEASDSFERALLIRPDLDWLPGIRLHTQLELCDWRDIRPQTDDLILKVRQGMKVARPFTVFAVADVLSVQLQAAEISANEGDPASPSLPSIGKRSRHNTIRVGYYSADFHNHATAYLMAGLFECHDRERFDVAAFSFGPETNDDMRRRLAAAFDQFIDVRATSDQEVARLSRQMEIDIAVDLKGWTQGGRVSIFSHRAAPIQVNYLGYPGTIGARYIDYIIADRTMIPEASRSYYSEKVAYLPNSYQVNDRKRKIADSEYSRTQLGLPPVGFVFCCFNSSYKITPRTFDGWMRILKQVPGSVLWLLGDDATSTMNLRREAEARGVSGSRLVFAPPMPLPEHLARHRTAGLFIDTLPCNAHTTASDALWAGLPVLTLIGESFAARVAASLLTGIGLPELIANTQEQYEGMAIELATNPDRLENVTAKLHRNRLTTPLFDTERFTRNIEAAYVQMSKRYQDGLDPDHIFVADQFVDASPA